MEFINIIIYHLWHVKCWIGGASTTKQYKKISNSLQASPISLWLFSHLPFALVLMKWIDDAWLYEYDVCYILLHWFLIYLFLIFQELERKRKERAQAAYEKKKQLTKLRVKAEKVADEKLGPQLQVIAPIKY